MSASWAPMENNDDGWDLFAVVRSCRAASQPPPAKALTQPMNTVPVKAASEGGVRFPTRFMNLVGGGMSPCKLEDFCKPFFSDTVQAKLTPSNCSSSAATAPQLAAPRRPLSQTTPRSKRRRNQQKRVVCQVPADGLAADMWAWRKYGQKPIKGSPYPRGYYRCSSSKGCLARKQVERSRTDAGKFIITYTGEHNHPVPTHRNSLAGSTRQKFPTPATIGEQSNQQQSSPNTPLKREEGSGEEEEEEDDEEEEEEGLLLVEDMEVVGEDEVLFMGMDKLQDSSSASSAAAFFDDAGDLDDGLLLHSWMEDCNSNR